MTAPHIIDPAGMLGEALSHASLNGATYPNATYGSARGRGPGHSRNK